MTRHVLEALRAANVPATDRIFEQARMFVERWQNFDADGFFFSPTEFDTIKAGHDGKHFRSYGTTTADGILALIALGRPPDDPRIVAARRWLEVHHHDMEVPGFSGAAYRRWPRGLAFYYASASTEVFRSLRIELGPGVAEPLERSERTDGSWANPEKLVKEHDPLIATRFAVRALVAAR